MTEVNASVQPNQLGDFEDLYRQLARDREAVVAARERVERSGNFLTRGVARASLLFSELCLAETQGRVEFVESALS